MATAVEPSPPTQPRTPGAGPGLLLASVLGALYVLAALAVVLYAVPALLTGYIAPSVGGDAMQQSWLRWGILLPVLAAVVWFGMSLAGANSPRGMRGGIFLLLAAIFLAFLLGGWATRTFEGSAGQVVAAVAIVGVAFGAFRLFTSPRGETWMTTLEDQGWFHASSYKRVLGRNVRRMTILGILIVGGTGIYSLVYHGNLPEHLDVTLPLAHTADGGPQTFQLVPEARFTIPMLLVALTLWVAWRAVNMPAFAEFLIATEAEMNKVSWSSRRRLAQDTVVVLVCTVFMALFLLFVDIFWGWLLSRETVGVLPSRSQSETKGGQVQAARW